MAPVAGAARGLLVETAAAKVNLSLRVLGRRADGYHELESLVVFAGVGDVVTLDVAEPLGLEVTGPEAAGLAEGPNLVLKAVEAARSADATLSFGRFRLEKHLPVAAGLGGGSADAAAALRLVARVNPERARHLAWMAIAAAIGSDVPVCLGGRAAMMSGRGEHVAPLVVIPDAWLVLANPRVGLSTSRVFRALGAPALTAAPLASTAPALASLDDLTDYLSARPNDLEPVAIGLCPLVGHVRAALSQLDGTLLARMSGSGATCFALFADAALAKAGAATLAVRHPDWWVQAAPIL